MIVLAAFMGRTVEVLDVSMYEGRKIAAVKVIEGEPIAQWTHGYWSLATTANVLADRLSDIRLEADPVVITLKDLNETVPYIT